LRLDPEKISNPIIYPNEGWLGEKMILIPDLIDPRFDQHKLVNTIGSPPRDPGTRRFGSVVICSSSNAAQKWKDAGAEIADTNTVASFVQRLVSGDFGTMVLTCLIVPAACLSWTLNRLVVGLPKDMLTRVDQIAK
jgi:hypothetical protein